MCAVLGGVLFWQWADPQLEHWSSLLVIPAAMFLSGSGGLLAALASSRAALDVADIDGALDARDRALDPDPALTGDETTVPRKGQLALAMTIAAIPSVDSLGEETKENFHKNVLTLETKVEGASTILTFRAYGLENESSENDPYEMPTERFWDTDDAHLADTYPASGFFLIDTVEITYVPD